MAERYEFEIEWDDEAEDPYKYVLGMDPGGTTGVALLRYTDDTLPELLYLHQIPDGMEGFYDFFEDSYPDRTMTIVSEKWKERNVKGADRSPQYIEGMQYGWWAHSLKRDPNPGLVYQYPEVKFLVPDEWLKEQNLWTPGKRHQMDALIHAIVFLRNSGHKPTIEALSEQGSKQGQIGQGNPEDAELGEDAGSAAEALAEAMEALQEALEEAGEAIQAAAEALSEANGQQEGEGKPVGHGGGRSYSDREIIDVEITGTRAKREKNGVFMGYESGDATSETVLFSD